MLQFADSIQKTVKTYPQAVPKTRMKWYSPKAIKQHKILSPLGELAVYSDHHWLGKLMKKISDFVISAPATTTSKGMLHI